MLSKSRLQQIRNEDERMIYSQEFFGNELENLEAACNFHGVHYKVFCNYREIASNCTFDEPSSYMSIITDSPTKLTNLYLCTELSDAIYLHQSLRTDGLEKRLDVWLGLAADRIEPNPSELPPLDPNSIINQFDQIEEQYKIVIYFSCVCEHQLFLNSCGCEEVFDLKTSSHPHENIFLAKMFSCASVRVCVGGLDRPRWVYSGHTCSHTWPI